MLRVAGGERVAEAQALAVGDSAGPREPLGKGLVMVAEGTAGCVATASCETVPLAAALSVAGAVCVAGAEAVGAPTVLLGVLEAACEALAE